MRDKTLAIKLNDFMEDPELIDQDIWDLKYISTSDEEDNDSDIASEEKSDNEEESEDEYEDEDESDEDSDNPKRKEKKMQLVGGENMPPIFRKFKAANRKGAKAPPRI